MDLIKDINDATREEAESKAASAAAIATANAAAEAAGKSVQDYLTDIQGKEKE